MSSEKFMYSRVKDLDLVLLSVEAEIAPQEFRGHIEHIYSSGIAIDRTYINKTIDFVGGADTWGNISLAQGNRALVFFTRIHGKLYEDHWRGHILLEDVEGKEYAFYDIDRLLENNLLPECLTKAVKHEISKPPLTAFDFEAFETYLIDCISEIRNQKAVSCL